MRLRPWHVLLAILALALAAGWVVYPGRDPDPFGWKENIAVRQGLDLQGGLQVLMEARPPAGQTVDASVLQGTKDTIDRRINNLGVSEPVIQTRGNNQIIVELPGIKNPEQAVELLRQTALLEIVSSGQTPLAEGTVITTSLGGPEQSRAGRAAASATPGTPGAAETPAQAVPASSVASPPPAAAAATATPPTGPTYQTIIQGKDLSNAYPTTDELGRSAVGFELKGEAADKFYQFTSSNVGKFMSIVVDKQLINSASINSPMRDRGII